MMAERFDVGAVGRGSGADAPGSEEVVINQSAAKITGSVLKKRERAHVE
jgi:hypothetical protein